MRWSGRLSFSLIILVLFALAACQPMPAVREGPTEKTFDFTEPLKPGGRIELKTYKGEIRIRTWDKAQVTVHAVMRPGSELFRNDRWRYTVVEVTRWGNTVRIRSRSERRRPRIVIGFYSEFEPYVDYEIQLPRRVRFELDDYKSHTVINALEGELRLDTYKGDAEITDFRGRFDLETYKGNICLELVDLTDHSTVETYRGEIDLRVRGDGPFRFEAELGRRAELDTDFELATVSRRREQRLLGQVGTGQGPLLRLKSYRGYFRLRR